MLVDKEYMTNSGNSQVCLVREADKTDGHFAASMQPDGTITWNCPGNELPAPPKWFQNVSSTTFRIGKKSFGRRMDDGPVDQLFLK